MTPQDIIPDVRVLVSDTDATEYRYSDADMLRWFNQSVQRISHLRPELFSSFEDFACATNQVVQTLPADCIRLMEVLYVVGGSAVHETVFEALTQSVPTYAADAAGPAINWARYPRDARSFVIYPKAPASQTLRVNYAKMPAPYTLSDTVTPALDNYRSAIIDCMVYLAMSVDDEHVNSNRAQQHYRMFAEALGISGQSAAITDAEKGRSVEGEGV